MRSDLTAQNAAREKAYKTLEADDKAALTRLLDDRNFRRFMWRVLDETLLFGRVFDERGNITAFNEGKRHIGLRLFRLITDVNPDAFLQMQKENAALQAGMESLVKNAANIE
jgi:hypothetical protein